MLSLIEDIWLANPDLRLMQLLMNAIPRNRQAPAVYMFEDKDLYEALKSYQTLHGREE